MSEKSEALRLADYIDQPLNNPNDVADAVSAELRFLHAENEELRRERDEARRTVREAHEAGTRLTAQRDALLEALKGVLLRDERNTCRHEETHRGGAIWEICDSCGAMWADDQGGKPKWENPKEWTQARAAIKMVEEGE